MTHIKNIIAVLVLILTSHIALAQTEWVKAESDLYNLKHPSDWVYNGSPSMGLNFMVSSPSDGPKDDFSENINLVETQVPADAKLDDLLEPLQEQLKAIITDFKLVSTKKTDKSLEVVYTGTMGKYKLQWKQWYMLKGETAYILSFTAQTTSYSAYLPTATKIVESFSPAK